MCCRRVLVRAGVTMFGQVLYLGVAASFASAASYESMRLAAARQHEQCTGRPRCPIQPLLGPPHPHPCSACEIGWPKPCLVQLRPTHERATMTRRSTAARLSCSKPAVTPLRMSTAMQHTLPQQLQEQALERMRGRCDLHSCAPGSRRKLPNSVAWRQRTMACGGHASATANARCTLAGKP